MSLKLKIGMASVLVLLVLGTLIFWMTHPVKTNFPLDQNLITLFTSKHDVFEKLRKMADEDWGKQATFPSPTQVASLRNRASKNTTTFCRK